MKSLYSAPLRVYLMLAGLALAGIYAGMGLPVSLFPNSSKPTIDVVMNYGNYTPEEFLNAFGSSLEEQLRGINTERLHVNQVSANYERSSVDISVEFDWGCPPLEALREVNSVVNAYSARFPSEIRNSMRTWSNSENSGFMAVSFYSSKRSLNDIYNALDPILSPLLAKVQDAGDAGLYNPARKDVQIEINPERMASLQLLPRDLSRAIEDGLYGANGGSFASVAQTYSISMPRALQNVADLAKLPVRSNSGAVVHLGDIAKIEYAIKPDGTRSFKTNGAPSIILFAEPKAGGNVKRMSEDVLSAVVKSRPNIPSDIEYKVLVDPSEFIRSAIQNVMREVLMGGLLAVCILFLFVGSFRNTVTAAIEIPLSMVLAFIPMKLSGMNLNLISLGGLALSAGMNVDASVVVMENIFRHFEEEKGPLTSSRKLEILIRSVKEVRFSVIASTIASLVVFLPLAFTSQLSNAILGDLAKTVVFSHGFSAFVALILVPTVRLQLMSGKKTELHVKSPIEPWIVRLENLYEKYLDLFIRSARYQRITYISLATSLVLLLALALPRLPKEIVGMPDTDWIMVRLNAKGNTMFRQMDAQTEEFEAKLLADFGEHIQYTFTQVNQANRASVMARLKDKSEMRQIWKAMEAKYVNTPFMRFGVDSWNPAELPIPNPPALKVSVQGGTLEDRSAAAEELSNMFEEHQVVPRVWTNPDVSHSDTIVLKPNLDRWAALDPSKLGLTPSDLADMVRVATSGKPASIDLPIDGRTASVNLRFPQEYVKTPEDIGSLPVGAGGKLMPLRGLVQVSVESAKPPIYRENGREMFQIIGRNNSSSDGKSSDKSYLKQAEKLADEWKTRDAQKNGDHPSVVFEEADKDLNDALKQLSVAVGLSILLIFITLVVQFGSFMNALLVMVAIPLGMIGVIASLFVFRSTLSLNSALGVILLNGISVANSIILVDFQKKLFDQGKTPLEAALEAGRKRLRPILITSLTTILAMLPVALGLGEGGRILQPLGIAVAGGLWVSMGFTLFVVPALQVAYLKRQKRPDLNPTGIPVETLEAFDNDDFDTQGMPSHHPAPEMIQ
ncbi:MAG: efflux RND transporter permease subunit [Bdellovibrionia bacterium]